jgi:hypothetical protein
MNTNKQKYKQTNKTKNLVNVIFSICSNQTEDRTHDILHSRYEIHDITEVDWLFKTYLTLSHVCTCLKPEPGFPKSNIVVFLCSVSSDKMKRWFHQYQQKPILYFIYI